jgi:hypothetical protein
MFNLQVAKQLCTNKLYRGETNTVHRSDPQKETAQGKHRKIHV